MHLETLSACPYYPVPKPRPHFQVVVRAAPILATRIGTSHDSQKENPPQTNRIYLDLSIYPSVQIKKFIIRNQLIERLASPESTEPTS